MSMSKDKSQSGENSSTSLPNNHNFEALSNLLEFQQLRTNPFNYMEALSQVKNLARRRAKISIEKKCGFICRICEESISDDQYLKLEHLKGVCGCEFYFHKQCFIEQVHNQVEGFKSTEAMLNILNGRFFCKSESCKQAGRSVFNADTMNECFEESKVQSFIQHFKEEEEEKKEIEQIEGQKNESFYCNICFYDEDNFYENGIKLKCGHTYCKDMIIGFFKDKISQPFSSLKDQKCLVDDCTTLLSFEEIMDILRFEKTQQEKMDQLSIQQAFHDIKEWNPEATEVLIECSGLRIERVTEVPDPDGEEGAVIKTVTYENISQENLELKMQGKRWNLTLKENEKIKVCGQTYIHQQIPGKFRFKCKNCNYAICLNKCSSIHMDKTCEQFKESYAEKKLLEEEQKEFQRLGYQYCPNCNLMVFKTRGCSHITCTKCKGHFCYICQFFNANSKYPVYEHMRVEHKEDYGIA